MTQIDLEKPALATHEPTMSLHQRLQRGILFFVFLRFYLFILRARGRERVSMSWRKGQRERERIPSILHTEHGAQCGA